jgi:hypothetical protein
MNNISRFLSRFERRSLLIAVAVVLAVLYLGRWGADSYEARQVELESKRARLEQDNAIAERVELYAERLKDLDRQKVKVEKYFFSGETNDKIASAMQLRIQALVSRAGLQAESIRPIRQKKEVAPEKGAKAPVFGEVSIKVRLAGTLMEFMDFMSELYKGEEFFKVENFNLKPYRNTGLKIFIDLKGYYILPDHNNDAGGTGS